MITKHRRAGSMLPYSRVDDTYLPHHPWNREAPPGPSVRGFYVLNPIVQVCD